MGVKIEIRDQEQGRERLCRALMDALPAWFGIPAANESMISSLAQRHCLAAVLDGQDVGMIVLGHESRWNSEIHWMAVDPAVHGKGVGRSLIEAAAKEAGARGALHLTVKTLSEAHPDPNYAATRAFYEAVGFLPLAEFPDLWGAELPCLTLMKKI